MISLDQRPVFKMFNSVRDPEFSIRLISPTYDHLFSFEAHKVELALGGHLPPCLSIVMLVASLETEPSSLETGRYP